MEIFLCVCVMEGEYVYQNYGLCMAKCSLDLNAGKHIAVGEECVAVLICSPTVWSLAPAAR